MRAPARTVAAWLLLAWMIAVFAFGVFQALRGSAPLASWLGLALTAGAPLTFLARRGRRGAGIPASEALPFTMVSGLGLAICMVTTWRYGAAAGGVHLTAGATFVAWVAFARLSRSNP